MKCLIHKWEYSYTSPLTGKKEFASDKDNCWVRCKKCRNLKKIGPHIFKDVPGTDLQRCERCGYEISTTPDPVPGLNEMRTLVDQLAHYHSFSTDRAEETKMAERLLAGGTAGWKTILNYLHDCAYGYKSDGWWYNAPYLVRLFARFPDADLKEIYEYLISIETNRLEYNNYVSDVAKQELDKLEKPDSLKSSLDEQS